MNAATKRRIAILTIAATAAGGSAAWAATSSKQDLRQEFLNDVAKRLDVSPEQLTSALKGAYLDQLDKAVADGKLTRAQADAIKKRVEQSGVPLGLGGPGIDPGRGFGHRFGFGHGGPRFGALDGAAIFLGLSEAELRKQLQSGTSLADVAKAQGKSEEDLVAALVAAQEKKLDKAVADKRISDAQRDAIVKDLPSRVKALVEGTPPAGGPHGRPWGAMRPAGDEPPVPSLSS